ncbi:MAG: Kelch repeat-containing protein, partial [Acidobacteriota bacterium]
MNEETSEREAGNRAFPDLPRAITSFGAAVVDDSIYVYGGHHGRAHHYSLTGQSGELLQLDLKKPLAWRVVATGPKLQGLALVTYGGKLYCIGGFTARNKDDENQDLWSVPDFAQFDPWIREWKQLPSMPTPRSSFDAVVAGDHLYVVGGWAMQGGEKTVWQDMVYTVDLSQRLLEWSLVAEPPFQRRALSAGAFNGRVYVIGGMQPDGKVTTRT